MIRIITSVDKALSELLQNRTVDLEKVETVVKDIVTAVKNGGDEQLCAITNRLDGTKLAPEDLAVGQDEVKAAYRRVSEGFLTALRLAAQNIYRFHSRQRRNSWIDPQPDGTTLGQMISPLGRVGIYVPGGKASYPSSVLMNAIPAAVAGVRHIVMVTPPDKSGAVNPHTLVAAAEAGVTEIYRVGGAQAVAALAYGTESIARVDKIVGPGNIYVTAAKRQVFGAVDIDMLAGPSEVLIVADDSARADFVAADMLAQAEHDEMASSILVTPVAALAEKVQQELNKQLARLTRRQVAEKSINERGAIIITATLDEAVQVANAFAPEHLELMVADPYRWLGSVHGAGAVFLGHFSPEPVGDYMAGPNHVLPTGGTARFFSPLNVDTFTKKTSLIGYSPRALAKDGEHVVALANTEGLTAHAASVQYRLAALAESAAGELSGASGINGGISDKNPSNYMLPDLPGIPTIKPGFGNLPGRGPQQKWNESSPTDFNRLSNFPVEGEKR